jgi:hypothetical protein
MATPLRVARLTVGAPTLVPIAIAILLFLACSGTPAVRLGRDTFEKKVASESRGQIALTNFAKTNGVQREVAGQRMYTMEFTSTLRFETGGWKGGDAFAGYFNNFAVGPGQPGGWSAFGQSWKYFERNAELQADGEIQFENTENGWRPTVVEVKKVAVLSNRPDEQYYDRFAGFWANRDRERSDLRILKDGALYKSVDQTYHSEKNLSAENQALTYRELDMPVYMHLDETGKQLHAGVFTYDRIEDEAAYKKARTQSASPATGTVAPATSAPCPLHTIATPSRFRP